MTWTLLTCDNLYCHFEENENLQDAEASKLHFNNVIYYDNSFSIFWLFFTISKYDKIFMAKTKLRQEKTFQFMRMMGGKSEHKIYAVVEGTNRRSYTRAAKAQKKLIWDERKLMNFLK